MQDDLQQELIRELIVESREGLDQFDQDLLAIENQQNDEETLHRIFRAIHTLKGSSGCLGLKQIERLAHAGENLLSVLRDRLTPPDSATVAALFRFCDALRRMVADLETGAVSATADHAAIIADLNALHSVLLHGTPPEIHTEDGSSGLFEDEPGSSGFFLEPAPKPAQAPPETATSDGPVAIEAAIRVGVTQLDQLMDLVGELVLTRNQIIQHAATLRDPAILQSSQRLNTITSKLQESVMKTRMQPVGQAWSKFPRLVRDLSHELKKPVSLVMEGGDTEIDRTLLEAIKDPLTHILRNSIDHGIESTERRRAAHKPEAGHIRLRAFHDGGQVVIQLSDDGGGIDRERVLAKAIERGLIESANADRLADRDVFALIFAPGFSTAEAITTVSGRGVGMDVVKKNVEKIGGKVEVESVRGRSTTVRLKIPLTLAIIPALLVLTGGKRYAIAQASLLELVRLEQEQAAARIEFIRGCPVYRRRSQLLPLLYLHEQLGIAPPQLQPGDAIFLLIVEAEGCQFGVVVDAILDTEEIVVKPLGEELKAIPVYAGATIMGDGRVALILDVVGMARRAGLLQESRLQSAAAALDPAAATVAQEILLMSLGANRQAAVPLADVYRLEEISAERIEMAGNSEVVQYRSGILPLISVAAALGLPVPDSSPAGGKIRVVVYSHQGAQYGLVVERILDIVRADAPVSRCTNRPGIAGSSVVGNRVTDFLDVPALVSVSGVVSYHSAENWGLF